MDKKITVSIVKGEGKIGHNNREYTDENRPKNIDPTLTENNIIIKQESIEEAYEKLFGESIRQYDEKQTREDRKYGSAANYLEKISRSKQQEPFYEMIGQFGDMFTHGIHTGNEEEAKQMLLEAFKEIEAKYPQLYFFNVVIHMDEATPHWHADYIPFAHGYKKGLETRVAMSKSLEQMGFKANDKFKTPLEAWQSDTRTVLRSVAISHGYEVIHTAGKTLHKTVEAYKRDIEQKQREFAALGLPEHIERKPVPLSKDKVIVNKEDLDKLEKAVKITAEERILINTFKPLWEELKKNAKAFIEKMRGLDRIKEKAQKIVSGETFKEMQQKLEIQKKTIDSLEKNVRHYENTWYSPDRVRQYVKENYISKKDHEKELDQAYTQGFNAGIQEMNRDHDYDWER